MSDIFGGFDPISSAVSFLGGERANSANKKIAREQMAFQERMANTVHQRAVTDLRAAGLNPRLSAMGGLGAPAPTGSSAGTQSDSLTPAVNSGLSAKRTSAEVQNMQETNKAIQAQTNLTQASTASALADIPIKRNTAQNLATQNHILGAEAQKADRHSELNNTGGGKFTESLGNLFRNLNPFLSGASSAKGLTK